MDTLTLMFHEIGVDLPVISGYSTSANQRYAFTVRGLEEIIKSVKANPNRLSVRFTFDDGGVSNLAAASVLSSHGVIGYFFVSTGYLSRPGFMTPEQVKEIASMGHEIGSHSVSHPHIFRALTLAEQTREFSESALKLQELLDRSITSGSVPGGDMNKHTIRAAASAGITDLFTSEPTVKSRQVGGTRLHGRVPVYSSTPPEEVERWINQPNRALLPIQLERKAKTTAKRLAAPLYARRISSRLNAS